MNNKERILLDLIRKNPYVSQQELADSMDLSRPSVANLISGLVKQGHIRGKAYVLNESKNIVCIGGANVDRKFYVKDQLQMGTSNPIRSNQTVGGVARNIAENFGRFGMETTLLTAGGKDAEWELIAEASAPYMNLDHVTRLSTENSGSYTAILDEHGELAVGLADMDIFDRMDPEWIHDYMPLLNQAKCILADLNCPKATLQVLCELADARGIPLVLVTVSAPKMKNMPEELSGVTWIITNVTESEAYFGGSLTMESAVQQWLDAGVRNVIVTEGSAGAAVGNHKEAIQHVPASEIDDVTDVTGAGDAFSAAVTYTWLEGKDILTAARAGIANATRTLESAFTVRQDLSAKKLREDMEELS
ncbi:PfkB family carbohydrate kinase [Virgibacillus siamensis]|uniref:PfkB family carbohydrate kinase n=1 Tax=Virgibacillus siamensis TaxID=480071 RepID=UPI000986D18B|nr:PfkB family carbohydrate kinase [Virgibacillus siamensis]